MIKNSLTCGEVNILDLQSVDDWNTGLPGKAMAARLKFYIKICLRLHILTEWNQAIAKQTNQYLQNSTCSRFYLTPGTSVHLGSFVIFLIKKQESYFLSLLNNEKISIFLSVCVSLFLLYIYVYIYIYIHNHPEVYRP